MQNHLPTLVVMSRRAALPLLFMLIASGLFAQDFSRIDAQARNTKAPKSRDLGELAQALSKGCTTEKEKVRSFFTWIADHIDYDVKALEDRKKADMEERYEAQQPTTVLKRELAVCEGYANLLQALCRSADIEAEVVTGLTKNRRGTIPRIGHAWIIVRTDGQWGLIDPTWAAGDVDTDEGKYTKQFHPSYFFMAPEAMIADHYPFDPLFQLLPHPLTLEEFRQRPEEVKSILRQKTDAAPAPQYVHLSDSLEAFARLDTLQQDYVSGRRALSMDPESNYGIFKLGLYQYRVSGMHWNKFTQEFERVNQIQAGERDAWLSRQQQNLDASRTTLTASIETFRKSTRSDQFTASIRSGRLMAERMMMNSDKAAKQLEQVRTAWKQGGKRGG